MELKRSFVVGIVLVLIMALFNCSHANQHVSVKALERQGAKLGRNLGGKAQCPVPFDTMDYKVVTDKCVAPDYDADICCKALTDLMCPNIDLINDVDNNNCASLMFHFLHIAGKYPDGLFFRKCADKLETMECPDTAGATPAGANPACPDPCANPACPDPCACP